MTYTADKIHMHKNWGSQLLFLPPKNSCILCQDLTIPKYSMGWWENPDLGATTYS
jgi:hypothetical protein